LSVKALKHAKEYSANSEYRIAIRIIESRV